MKEVAWCDSLQMNSVKKREAQNTRVKDAGPGDKHGEDGKNKTTEAEMLSRERGRRWGGAGAPAGEVSARECWGHTGPRGLKVTRT